MEKEKDEARTVPMKVLALGLSRSGTMSVKTALEQLGFGPVYHGLTMNPHVRAWRALAMRKYHTSPSQQRQNPITRSDLDAILGPYSAVTDMPCAAFWRELIDAYPSAKIVLAERDLETWHASFDAIVVRGMFSLKLRAMVFLTRLGLMPESNASALYPIFYGKFRASSPAQVSANAREVYVEHGQAVRAYAREKGVPLLEYRVGQGWEPLCEFLGVSVPDAPFPKTHERDWMGAMIERAQRRILRQALPGLLLKVAGIVAAVAIGWVWGGQIAPVVAVGGWFGAIVMALVCYALMWYFSLSR